MRKNGQKVSKNRMKKDSKATRIVTVICLCWAAFVAVSYTHLTKYNHNFYSLL